MRSLTVLVADNATVTDQGFPRSSDTFVRQYTDVAPEGILTFTISRVPSVAVIPVTFTESRLEVC